MLNIVLLELSKLRNKCQVFLLVHLRNFLGNIAFLQLQFFPHMFINQPHFGDTVVQILIQMSLQLLLNFLLIFQISFHCLVHPLNIRIDSFTCRTTVESASGVPFNAFSAFWAAFLHVLQKKSWQGIIEIATFPYSIGEEDIAYTLYVLT